MQDYSNWEVIVSDNFSEDDVEGYIHSLNEPRIKYFRTDSFVSVTDNWNYALSKSSGDYIIMIGDDDALVAQSLQTLDKWIQEYQAPDLIYTAAFLYSYPGINAGLDNGGIVYHPNAPFLKTAQAPFFLEKKERENLVKRSMNFYVRFGYNIQFSIFNKNLVPLLMQKGEFFQSSYPDYYTANVLFLKAPRVLACPTPLVIVGICPESFGCHYFNNREEKGMAFLNNPKDKPVLDKFKDVILPGTQMNTFWLFTMQLIKENYEDEYPNLKVGYSRYRRIQILRVFASYAVHHEYAEQLSETWSRMKGWEKIGYTPFLIAMWVGVRFFPRSLRKRAANKLLSIFSRSHWVCRLPQLPGVYSHMGELLGRLSSVKPYIKTQLASD